jgi:hypothetical protein
MNHAAGDESDGVRVHDAASRAGVIQMSPFASCSERLPPDVVVIR